MLQEVNWDDISAGYKRVPIVHGEKFRKAVQAVNPSVQWVE
jgi:hypothetical protein